MRTLIVGFDSFDPKLFESFAAQDKLPNLRRLAGTNGYSSFRVCSPPQTEVSWTSIATGADPGSHGIFDFVHRNPANYAPFVSILPTQTNALGTQFVPPYKARTLFEEAVDQGYPATALWWPAMFPARPESPVRVLPGLGTPDIRGQLGVGALFASAAVELPGDAKTPLEALSGSGKTWRGALKGPFVKQKGEVVPALSEFQFDILDEKNARLTIGGKTLDLTPGRWSPILEVSFKTGWMMTVQALTRVLWTSSDPVKLYFLPLQIHPLHALWRYASPQSFVKQTWEACGPFLSLGWPQDTTALEDGCISDEQFIDLCQEIFSARERILMYQLDHFREGVLASIFDDLDRMQHMFRRDRPDAVADWYGRLDAFVGRVTQKIDGLGGEKVHLMVMSDHGFADFKYKVHLNHWLADKGHLVVKQGATEKNLSTIDWSKTSAYAVGLNSLYINLQGREGQGIVPVEQVESVTAGIKAGLDEWKGPDGRLVFGHTLLRHEAFSGPLLRFGPDLVLGYNPGYRASAETGLGKWDGEVIATNTDHWGADHCIDAQAVPGVLFSSRGLADFPNPSFRDIPAMVVGKYLDNSKVEPPSTSGGESQQTIEERLKGLGYL